MRRLEEVTMEHTKTIGALTRRQVVKGAGATLAAGALTGLFPGLSRASGRRPNIVFILSDDHRWDHFGVMNHPWIQTPNLDRLAGEGVLFSNAFCTTSLCSPSRASFISGKYVHNHGVINNLTPWNNKNLTVLELLKRGGYRTGFIGKWHMPGGLPKLRGVDEFVSFTYKTGQGVHFDCPLVIDGQETPRPGKYLGEDLTDLALEFINQPSHEPFALYLCHKAPHHPFTPPHDLEDLYRDESIAHLPKSAHHRFAGMVNDEVYGGMLWNVEAKYKKYCSLITSVDQQVGRVMDQLERLGIAENTIVIYSTDNGYLMGDKGHFDKRWAYDRAMRIPMIVRYPDGFKNAGQRSEEMVLNIDLAPTLLDLAGLPVDGGMDGRSFSPVLQDPTVPFREWFPYEFYKDFPPYTVPSCDAIRTRSHLYVDYNDSRRASELYDIRTDPENLHDLMGSREAHDLLPEMERRIEQFRRSKNGAV